MNIPNVLSLFRILLVPFVAYFFYLGNVDAALLIFLTASITDVLDGYIARKYNMITDLGKILDPIADKAMQITVLVSMAMRDMMLWVVVLAIITKEIMMFLGGVSLFRKNVVVGANFYGKAATVVTSACVVLILLFYDSLNKNILLMLQWIPVVFAVAAFLRYLVIFVGFKGKNKKEQE